ncbi:TAP42-like protein, partial [Amylostereum chailletii]
MDSLPAIFHRALASLSKASDLPTIEDATQDVIDSALKDLRNARGRISDLGLFSPNETLEDISTRDLVYLLVPFVLAEAENRARATERDDRLVRLQEAQVQHYEIVPESERSLYGKTASAIADASRRRETKIKQYKAEKEIRGKIEALRHRRHSLASSDSSTTDFDLVATLLPSPTSAAADPSADEDSDTEEVLRDATLLVLRLFYAQSQGQLEHINQELELLRNAPPPSRPARDDTQQKTDEIDWKLDARRNDGPLLDPKGK